MKYFVKVIRKCSGAANDHISSKHNDINEAFRRCSKLNSTKCSKGKDCKFQSIVEEYTE